MPRSPRRQDQQAPTPTLNRALTSRQSLDSLLIEPLRQEREEIYDASSARDSRDSSPGSHAARPFQTPNRHASGRRSLFVRLGAFIVITNILALIGLFVAIGFVSWLWFGDEGDAQRRRLILDGYLEIAVTLSSIFIRTAVTTQATTVVAMLAALALESSGCGGVRLRDAPAMSIARYSNSGPLSALLLFWSALKHRCNWPLALILLTTYTSVTSQFTSTLLLKDLSNGPIVNLPQSMSNAVGFGFDTWYENNMTVLLQQGRNYWASPPASFPSFAEWSEDPKVELDSVKDTGPSLRAFLPIVSPETRTSLQTYDGTADVFDTRVFCSRPVVHFDKPDYRSYGLVTGTLVHGNLTDEMVQLLRLPEDRTSRFNISIGTLKPGNFMFVQLSAADGGMVSSLDPMNNSTTIDTLFHNRSGADVGYSGWYAGSPLPGPNNQSDAWHVELGHAFLFLARPSIPEDVYWAYYPDNPSYNSLLDYLSNETPGSEVENGVWLEYPRNETESSGGYKLTVCYDALFATVPESPRVLHHQSFPIRASQASGASEPIVKWNATTTSFDTIDISKRYLPSSLNSNSTSQFKLERWPIDQHLRTLQGKWSPFNYSQDGLNTYFYGSGERLNWYYDTSIASHLNLSEEPWAVQEQKPWAHPELLKAQSFDFVHDSIWSPFKYRNFSASVDLVAPFEIAALCGKCPQPLDSPVNPVPESRTRITLHPILTSIANDVFNATDGNPAVTWQALLTIVLSSAYYDWLPAFSRNDTMTITTVVERSHPRNYTGFAIIMATVALQLIISAVVLVLFWKLTRFTLLDSAWLAVSQILSAETLPLLLDSTMTKDGDIKPPNGIRHGPKGEDGKRKSERAVRVRLRESDDGRITLRL
ncbi:hypothetical protein F5B21DRAFT_34790 [Xylaria acuta]|nr:hypothetical protein F5B21DRAFT_34790 [Xylaria acuta]